MTLSGQKRPSPAKARKAVREPRPSRPGRDPVAVLAPYHPERPGIGGRTLGALLVAGVVYGIAYAFFAPYLAVLFALPIAVLGGLVIWALPDSHNPPTGLMEFSFWGALIALVLWPNYLAIALPGLPWITINRLLGAILSVLLLTCLSISHEFRARLAEPMRRLPLLPGLLAGFVLVQFLSVFLSSEVGFSAGRFLNAQVGWTATFFVGCFVFQKPGRIVAAAYALWAMAIVVSLIALLEWREGHVPWAGHIPPFLRIDDETVAAILVGGARAATGQYRVQSTFTTSLGLAEYIALAVPFILHFVVRSASPLLKALALASAAWMIPVVILTDSRLGMIGCLLSVLLYVLIWAAGRWKTQRGSLIGPAITLAYPVIFAMALLATFFVHRLRARVWGNGPQQASDDSRIEQWQMAWPKIFHRPIGYGAGMGGQALNFVDVNGKITIDSYYLSIVLEYGVIGFLLFYGMLLVGVHLAARRTLARTPMDRDVSFLAPLAIALINFFVIKAVFSQQENHPLVFMMLGGVLALAARPAPLDDKGAAPVAA